MKKILILGAGYEQIIAIEHAKELGYKVVAVDGNDKAPGLKIADIGIHEDLKDKNKMLGIAKEHNVDGIMTHAVEVGDIVAWVATELNLPTANYEAVLNATYKDRRIDCFSKNGIACPKYFKIYSIEDAREKSRILGFPCVIKPVDGAGARGVIMLNEVNDIEWAYHESKNSTKQDVLLLEQYINGVEISTESIIVDGKIITTGFADRNYENKEKYFPYFIEDGHSVPSKLAEMEKEKIIKVVENAIKSLGLDFGVAKGDVVYAEGEVYIFEMAPRTSGGRFCSDMVPLATGINIIKPLIQMSVGDKVDLEYLRQKFYRGSCQRFFLPPKGTLKEIRNLEKIKSYSGMYEVYLNENCVPGYEIPSLNSHRARVGYVIVSEDDVNTAIEIAEAAISTVEFVID